MNWVAVLPADGSISRNGPAGPSVGASLPALKRQTPQGEARMEYQAIEKWQRPECFLVWAEGAPYDGEWYVFLGRNRDSSTLDQSNFQRGLELIGGKSETVMIVRESHWGVGWVEWIAIHESDQAALAEADEILCALSEYPVVDDTHYSELEHEAIAEYWEREPIKRRASLCRDAGYPIMGARHDFPPEPVFDHIRETGACA